ncbi:MAG TPA: response regulator [Chloroflexota bacterium]|nr:response regulator [Chloroflexota bacterium]
MAPNVSPSASSDASGRALHPPVMVVEDDESLRELLAHYLGREGYPVEQAADGAAALRALERRRALGAPPGLVLLDLMLPRVSGLDVLAHLNAAGADVPVVVMSVYDHLLSKAAAGAQGVLIKPFDLEQLLPVVARYCGAAGGDTRPAPRPA